MTAQPPSDDTRPAKKMPVDDRLAAKRAQNLRANLLRRKQQSQARTTQDQETP